MQWYREDLVSVGTSSVNRRWTKKSVYARARNCVQSRCIAIAMWPVHREQLLMFLVATVAAQYYTQRGHQYAAYA